MIGFAVGTILGIVSALLYGRFKGRAGELIMAAMGIPVFTYLASLGFYGGWNFTGNVFFSTPLGDFTPTQLIGLETFLATVIAFTYIWTRSKNSLTIDELVGTSLPVGYTLVAGAGLSASESPLLFLLGLVFVTGYVFLSYRNPLRSLKAVPCGKSLKEVLKNEVLYCLTDDVSYGVYRVRDTLVIGGKFIKEFSRWKEVVKCLLKVPYNETRQKALVYGSSLLIVALGFAISPGFIAVAVLYALAFAMAVGTAVYVVGMTRKNLDKECAETMKEYGEFYRAKTKGRKERAR